VDEISSAVMKEGREIAIAAAVMKDGDEITAAVMKGGGKIAAAVMMAEEDEAIVDVLNKYLEEELPHYIF
jgi:hypothetical protein